MASRNLHDKPFDDETITKLEIFEDYAKAWIPTFVMQGIQEIHIYDFFAGTGYDKLGVPGSPIRLLDKITQHLPIIFQAGSKIKIHLNEFEPYVKAQKKFELLKLSCEDYLNSNKRLKHVLEISYYNEDFEQLFPKLLPSIKKYPALVYLDQNGIKFTSEKYFLELEKTYQTDFLYFISSSYFWRFGKSNEFKMHLNIDMDEAKKDYYKFIHVNIISQLRSKLPSSTKLKLYPFSLKKGTNIYGIIFGATHPRAVDKFLTIAWDRNKDNGQANFDLYDHAHIDQLDLFLGTRRRSRIESFQDTVRTKILSSEIRNNYELYAFTINEGYLGSHAAEVVKAMKKEGLITYNSTSPLVNYQNVYKLPRKLSYSIL